MKSPAVSDRIRLALAVAVITVLVSLMLRGNWSDVRLTSDFDQTVIAARLLLDGKDPYASIGPGRAYEWPWQFYYPLPAAMLGVPFAKLILPVASAMFIGVSGGLLAFAVTRCNYARLPLFASAAYLHAVWLAQWSPLLTAAVLMPAFAFVLPGKPTIGGALLLSNPSRLAIVGSVALVTMSVVVQPSWPREWLEIIRHGLHHRPPILLRGGFIVALAMFRWRRFDARLLLFLACAPQTIDVFEAVPLFLVCQTFRESLALATTVTIAYVGMLIGPMRSLDAQASQYGWLMIAGAYLPPLVMVLRRPNSGRAPAWLERLVAPLPPVLRGHPAPAGDVA